MWRALLFITATLAFAAQPWHINGRVVDDSGHPIEGAFFKDTAMASTEYFEHFTNAEGRFDIWTDSPRLTLSKAGYRDIVLTSKDANQHEIRMIKRPIVRNPRRRLPRIGKLTSVSEPLEQVAQRMRHDWNARALEDAKHYVYTRDPDSNELEFDASGRANYAQLIRPYLPILLRGANPRTARALEIGCGVGRMTRLLAENFGEVHAIDVAPEMIAQARAHLADHPNVTLHQGSGFDLQPLPDEHFDLVFSYIVFQHIPSAEVIRNYIREAARVLKSGGAFKFQLNGDQSDAYREHARDTWLGETFSRKEVEQMLTAAGLTLAEVEDPGTQYFVVTAFKGPLPDRRAYYLPGQPDDGGWRPVAPHSTIRLCSPGATKLYAGIYFWPNDPHREHQVTMSVNGASLGSLTASGSGDHYREWALSKNEIGEFELTMDIEPACNRDHWPALRIVGVSP